MADALLDALRMAVSLVPAPLAPTLQPDELAREHQLAPTRGTEHHATTAAASG